MDYELHDDRLDAILRSVNASLERVRVEPPADPQPGQVWRARWDDVLALVFIDAILDGNRNLIRVAPVLIGIDEADDSAILLPEESNPLSVALSVWPDLVTEIAEVVLEHWVTGFDGFRSLAAIRDEADRGNLRRGVPIVNELSPRHQERMLLELAMEVLSLAAEVPSGNGRLELLLAGVAVPTIAGVLNISAAAALKVLRGEIFIDRSQAQRLANALQRDPQELLDANPKLPEELTTALTSIRRSAEIRALAAKRAVSESAALTDATLGSLALAARDEGRNRDWAGRVDRFFQVALSA